MRSPCKTASGSRSHGSACIHLRFATAVSVLRAVNTAFTVLDETDDYIVVNKPAPLQIHPSVPNGTPTLWHGLRDLLAYEIANGGQISIINRLDRETSGAVLVAKHAAAARLFGMAMQDHHIRKTYLAIVHGWPEWDQRDLDAPILRKGDVTESPIWVKQMVHPDGAACRTEFRVLSRHHHAGIAVALVEAKPITGRMHQIRVHLSHLGHPILGDKIYGTDETCYLEFIDTGWTPALEEKLLISRQALHSHQLEVQAPNFRRTWEAPLLDELRVWAAV